MDEIVCSEDKPKLPTNLRCEWRTLAFGGRSVALFVPDPDCVKTAYLEAANFDEPLSFPYWTHLWPASIALCSFLAESPELVRGQRVLELAAGLGLPSLFVAGVAASVCCSDWSPEAVALAEASAEHNGLLNLLGRVIDWNRLPDDLSYDVVLMSDVNYDPEDLPGLNRLFDRLLGEGKTVILSTPERIVATDLIATQLSLVQQRQTYEPEPGRIIHVFCLRQSEDGFTSNR